MSSVTARTTPHAQRCSLFGRVDLVDVDGAHDYDAVRIDSENAIRMLRPGGYALWDELCNFGDYNDVTRAVIDTGRRGQVVQIANTQLAVYRKPVQGVTR